MQAYQCGIILIMTGMVEAQVNPALGQRIREIRKAKGLPLLVLHKLSGVSHQKIWLLEKWGIIPTHKRDRQRIAEVLGVPYEELWANVME